MCNGTRPLARWCWWAGVCFGPNLAGHGVVIGVVKTVAPPPLKRCLLVWPQ